MLETKRYILEKAREGVVGHVWRPNEGRAEPGVDVQTLYTHWAEDFPLTRSQQSLVADAK